MNATPQVSVPIVNNTAGGVILFIIAVIVLGLCALLWYVGINSWLVSALGGFALFLVASGIQGFVGVDHPSESDKNPLRFTKRKLPMILGFIPLGYAIIVGLAFAPTKLRVLIIFFVLFIGLIISYLMDYFGTKPSPSKDKMDKFYDKVFETHTALGVVDRGPTQGSYATRRVPLRERYRLLGSLLSVAPWQLLAAFVLAFLLMFAMPFID